MLRSATVPSLVLLLVPRNRCVFSEHLRYLPSHSQARAAAQQATVAVATSRRVAAATAAAAITAHVRTEAQHLANAQHPGSILAEAVLQRLAASNNSNNSCSNNVSPGGELRVLATQQQQQPSYGPQAEAGIYRQYQGRGLRPPNSRAPAAAVTTRTAGGGGGGVGPPPLSPLPPESGASPPTGSGGAWREGGSGGAWRESGSGSLDLHDFLHGSTMAAAPRFLNVRPPSFLTMAPSPLPTTAMVPSAGARAATTATAPISCTSPTMALLGGVLTSSAAPFGSSAPQQASSSWSVNIGAPPSRIGNYVPPHAPPAAMMGLRTRVSLSGGERGAAGVGGQAAVGQPMSQQQQRLAVGGGGWPTAIATVGGPQAGLAGDGGGGQQQQQQSQSVPKVITSRRGFFPAI